LALWREHDPDTFKATVIAAAERLDIQPLAVEKDYWACEALRAIVAVHPGQVIFKGGTSLEKLRITRRFSEDIDIIVVGEYPSQNAAKNALKAMMQTAASATGGKLSDEKSGGNPGTFWRHAYLSLPLNHSGNAPAAIADPGGLLLELGQTGGPKPSRLRPVESLLARELAATDVGQWDDLVAFDVPILHPARTLIEKLLRVNNFVLDPAKRDSVHGWPRIGRQFYDIWALLEIDEVLELLDDEEQVSQILTSAYEVSQAFGGDHPVPSGGFAASIAFDPSGEFADRLRREHNTAMGAFYYGADTPPSFENVLDRVHANAGLLVCGS
jgi:Nucleotidyl transferase AbiEii toxin, Type IV TA system